MDISVSFKGPLFHGRAPGVMADLAEQASREIANAALERVHYFLNAQIKHPTPYYETQIIQQRIGMYEVVHDRGIIYGPWLEGVSTRNARTRFKGYHSFRKAKNEVEALAPSIVERVVNKNLGRLQ